jgi:hypothetical protein
VNETTVRVLLAAAGLPATDAEIARYAAALPALRAGLALLHAAADREVEPAVRFRAEPDGVEPWFSAGAP